MVNQELEYRVLKILEPQRDLTQHQLSRALGVSLGKTNHLVKSLIDLGWVKSDNLKRPNSEWGYAYLLTPKGKVDKAATSSKKSLLVLFLNISDTYQATSAFAASGDEPALETDYPVPISNA